MCIAQRWAINKMEKQMKLSAKNQETLNILQAIYRTEIADARVEALESAMQSAIECGKISQSDMDNLIEACGLYDYDFSGLGLAGFKF